MFFLIKERDFIYAKINTEKEYAPPKQSEKKIGNTTFIVNSYFPENGKESVASKIEQLIKDDVRNGAINNLQRGRQGKISAV